MGKPHGALPLPLPLLLLLLLVMVFTEFSLLASACSSRHHQLAGVPDLFKYSNNISMSQHLCEGRTSDECHLVEVNLKAFLAKSMAVPIRPGSTISNSVEEDEGEDRVELSKRTEEGLHLILTDGNSAGTATITYSSKEGSVVFVLKTGRVYGTIKRPGYVYSLEPCFSQSHCHLWVKKRRKLRAQKKKYNLNKLTKS